MEGDFLIIFFECRPSSTAFEGVDVPACIGSSNPVNGAAPLAIPFSFQMSKVYLLLLITGGVSKFSNIQI